LNKWFHLVKKIISERHAADVQSNAKVRVTNVVLLKALPEIHGAEWSRIGALRKRNARLDLRLVLATVRFMKSLFCAILFITMTSLSALADAPYRHVVLFKFKDTATIEQVKAIETAFKALPSKISTIVDFEWGTNVSPEGKADGFTHCFLVTFKDKTGLDVYVPHAAHKEFGTLLRPQLDKVLVIDFVSQK